MWVPGLVCAHTSPTVPMTVQIQYKSPQCVCRVQQTVEHNGKNSFVHHKLPSHVLPLISMMLGVFLAQNWERHPTTTTRQKSISFFIQFFRIQCDFAGTAGCVCTSFSPFPVPDATSWIYLHKSFSFFIVAIFLRLRVYRRACCHTVTGLALQVCKYMRAVCTSRTLAMQPNVYIILILNERTNTCEQLMHFIRCSQAQISSPFSAREAERKLRWRRECQLDANAQSFTHANSIHISCSTHTVAHT